MDYFARISEHVASLIRKHLHPLVGQPLFPKTEVKVEALKIKMPA